MKEEILRKGDRTEDLNDEGDGNEDKKRRQTRKEREGKSGDCINENKGGM